MTKRSVVSFAVFIALFMPVVCAAAELLDAPGPGYHQQSERLSRSRHSVVKPKFSPSIQIYPANGAFSSESLSKVEQAFSQADRVIQSAGRSSEVEASGTVNQRPMDSAPKRAQ